MKQIVFVAGTAFCGSSLLNILLDTQTPAIRGLGERSQTDGEGGGPCILCNKFINECQLYSHWDGKNFYDFNFQHYGCNTLVDSSKRTNVLLRAMAEEPQFKYHVLHMSKTPHAAAYSILKHWQHDTWDVPQDGKNRDLPAALEVWRATNALYVEETGKAGVTAVKHVHYDTLVADPAAVVAEICQWIGEPFHPAQLEQWRAPTTHILGGNPAILMQVLGQDIMPADYLGGKYAARSGQIFVDEAWKRDKPFLKGCIAAYRQQAEKLDWTLAALGYGDTRRMIGECRKCLRAINARARAEAFSSSLAKIGKFFGLCKPDRFSM
jgi:hypothetical protein